MSALSSNPALPDRRKLNHEFVPVHTICTVSQKLPFQRQTPFTDFLPSLQYNKISNYLFLNVFLSLLLT
jgi:hypothetical protein